MVKGQGEFTKMLPERTPLGKKAVAYIEVCDEELKIKDQKEKIKKELVEQFLASGKTSIKIEGITVSYSHIEQDKLSVRQEKAL